MAEAVISGRGLSVTGDTREAKLGVSGEAERGLRGRGRERGMLSACFVLPVRDSIGEIFDSIKHTALIQKAGGGKGFAFDELRPTGDYISSSGGTTSGPISFWRAFSEATNAIQQGAFRRGANMGMMNIHHPDILKFLHAKEDLTQFTNYNISVKVTDEWMEAFLKEPNGPHVVKNPRTGRTYLLPKALNIWQDDIRSLTEIKAGELIPAGEFYTRQDIWDIILKNAHRTGEPGVVYIDRINEFNPTPHIGRMEATNPCGEQPLLPYEACNLGSINLAEFVHEDPSGAATIDWDALRETVHESTRYLDDIIDVNQYPLEEIDAICKANRKIGLGGMGFPGAPGGTISFLGGCRGGREPLYSLAFFRNVLKGQNEGQGPMVEINSIFEAVARREGFLSEGLMERLATEGTLANVPDVPDGGKRGFLWAHAVAPAWDMRVQ